MKEQERRKKGAQELKGIFKTSVKIFLIYIKTFLEYLVLLKYIFLIFNGHKKHINIML